MACVLRAAAVAASSHVLRVVETNCAAEQGICNCAGGAVRYGANHLWSPYHSVKSTVRCSNDVFGDAAPGSRKGCMCKKRIVCTKQPTAGCPACCVRVSRRRSLFGARRNPDVTCKVRRATFVSWSDFFCVHVQQTF